MNISATASFVFNKILISLVNQYLPQDPFFSTWRNYYRYHPRKNQCTKTCIYNLINWNSWEIFTLSPKHHPHNILIHPSHPTTNKTDRFISIHNTPRLIWKVQQSQQQIFTQPSTDTLITAFRGQPWNI